MKFLTTPEELLRRFRELLKSADRIDFASAWATEGHALDALMAATRRKRKPCQVRALIGINGNATRPEALYKLNDIGELRIVKGSRLFHPKVYVFTLQQGDRFAWIGSANFTGKGFTQNEEVVLETQETQQVEEWFDNRWEKAGPLDNEILEEYRKNYKPPNKNEWWDEQLPPPQSSESDAVKHTPPQKFQDPILKALHGLGGRGERPIVLKEVHKMMENRLNDADKEEYRDRNLKRWEQNVDCARQNLVREGSIKQRPDVPHGIWELTEAGKNKAVSTS